MIQTDESSLHQSFLPFAEIADGGNAAHEKPKQKNARENAKSKSPALHTRSSLEPRAFSYREYLDMFCGDHNLAMHYFALGQRALGLAE